MIINKLNLILYILILSKEIKMSLLNESKNNYKISTMTMSTKLPNCYLNLFNIGKYLQIDDEIIGIKYDHANLNVMKGHYSTTIYKKSKNKIIDKVNKTLFYNQISIIVKVNDHNINVKLFGNGSLHLTGCRNINDSIEVTKCIYKKLKILETYKTTILLTKDINSILIDNDNMIYSYSNFQIIGYKNNDKYIIFKKEYTIDDNTNMFILTKEEIQRKRSIVNLSGENIGYAKIELIKKHLALVFKHEIDPSMGNAEHQMELNNIHNPKPTFDPDSYSNGNSILRC